MSTVTIRFPFKACRTKLIPKNCLQKIKTTFVILQFFYSSVSTGFFLPFVSFDVVSLDVLEVTSQVILQRGDEAAVFVHQLSGSRLSCEPVDHR